MPKVTKLHTKGKTTSIQKPCKQENDSLDGVNSDESIRQFQFELCWCIQQLERSLNEKKGTEKQMQNAWKVLHVLKNNNQPIIRKRQLMRTHFGDYRAKMAAEEKKLVKMASKIKISEVPDKPKATFFRKSAFLTTGDNSFRFNFNVLPDQIDNENKIVDGSSSSTSTSNDGNTKAGVASNDKVSRDNSNNFKFPFSNTEFRFNFNVGDSY